MICVQNGNYVKWFQSNGSDPIYLPKRKRKFAEKLAAKHFYELQVKELTAEIALLERYLNQYRKLSIKSDGLLESSSAYHDLLNSYFQNYPDFTIRHPKTYETIYSI